VYFDFDCHTTGSVEDTKVLAAVVKTAFPTCSEFVFSERGASGWLVVDSSMYSPAEYNRLLRRIQDYYQKTARERKLDIEHVEVKGRVYEHTWDDRGRELKVVKAGDLIKCPPHESYLAADAISAALFEDEKYDTVETSPLRSEVGSGTAKPAPTHSAENTWGSFRPRLVTEEMQARIPDLVQFVREQFPDRPTRCDHGKRIITDQAFAELLLALFLLKPNLDGTNPSARHREFVVALHEQGVFSWAWNPYVYTAVRNYLSSKGSIDWQDETYRFRSSGTAMKWTLDSVLADQVDKILTTSPCTLVNTYSGEYRLPRLVLELDALPKDYEDEIMAMFDPQRQLAA
jgi:hypothetical protein